MPVSRRVQWIALAAGCALAALLQIVLYRHAGAFWRDEASTLLIAAAPDFGRMWDWLSKDSAPGLVYTLLRVWRFAGPDGSQEWLRLFGTLVALGTIASVAGTCRSLTGAVPLVAPALVLFNPSIFYYGSSLRAYGLATILILPCAAAFWRVARGPTRGNVAASALLGILSCHASYQNSYLLLAIGTAGAACALACRLWKRALLIAGLGLVAASSLSVYSRAILEYGDVARIVSFDVDLATVGRRLVEVAEGNRALIAVWSVLLPAAVIGLVARAFRQRRADPATPSLDLYLLIILLVANGAGALFFVTHGIYPHPWHYIPFLAVAGVVIEGAARPLDDRRPGAAARMAVAVLVVAVSLTPLWRLAHVRRTNLDRLASVVAARAARDDLILLHPFWLAPGFRYHYRGGTEWNTVPLTPSDLESSILPFAPIKRLMATPDAMRPTLARIEATLAGGHRLWVIGGIELPKPGAALLDLAPAPRSPFGWNSIVYGMAWSQQLGAFLRDRAGTIDYVPVDVGQPVNPLEMPALIRIEGRRR
jgi:hypothetical protein